MAHAVVIGGGVSGLGAAKLLTASSERKIIVSARAAMSAEMSAKFRALGCSIDAPSESLGVLDDADLVVFSPTVSSDNILLKNAKARGLVCMSEIDLALSRYSGQVVAVTGTNGKSTITSMIEHILIKMGLSVKACGNIGVPASQVVAESVNHDYLVIELSSYQLELSSALQPIISIFSSFSHDHLERHKTMARYFESKWSLVKRTRPDGLVIMTKEVANFASSFGCFGIKAKQHVVSSEALATELWEETLGAPLQMGGDDGKKPEFTFSPLALAHDRLNAVIASIASSFVTGGRRHDCLALLKDFSPLPHRCQRLGSFGGFPVINDSKSTNVEATMVALSSIVSPVVLFLGGKGKGETYKPIGQFSSKIKLVVVFGASRAEICEELKEVGLPVSGFDTLNDALAWFVSAPIRGAAILFSPACASFDEFRDFEHRGQYFCEKIGGLLDEAK